MILTMQDLKICYSLALEAREIMDMSESIRAMAERCTPSYSHGPKGSGISDKVGAGAVEIAEFWEKQIERAFSFLEHVTQVQIEINKLKDSYQRRVLQLRYIQGLPWNLVQMNVQYSESRAFYIHDQALKNLGIYESQE